MTKVVLDAEAFKALSSDTRLQILKVLDVRRLTVSEMGRLLGLNKATVFEHLKQLTVADLVKKEEDGGRKWVYYKLTWKGRNVVHPENAQFFLMLATSVLSVGGVVAALGRFLSWWGGPDASPESADVQRLESRPPPTQAPEQSAAGAQGDPGSPTPSPTANQGVPRDDADAGLQPVVEGSGGDDAWFEDPQLWIVGLLSLLVVLTVLLVWQLLGQRRAERAHVFEQIRSLPSNVNDAEEPASSGF